METTSTVFCSSDSGFASHMNGQPYQVKEANRTCPTDPDGPQWKCQSSKPHLTMHCAKARQELSRARQVTADRNLKRSRSTGKAFPVPIANGHTSTFLRRRPHAVRRPPRLLLLPDSLWR